MIKMTEKEIRAKLEELLKEKEFFMGKRQEFYDKTLKSLEEKKVDEEMFELEGEFITFDKCVHSILGEIEAYTQVLGEKKEEK